MKSQITFSRDALEYFRRLGVYGRLCIGPAEARVEIEKLLEEMEDRTDILGVDETKAS